MPELNLYGQRHEEQELNGQQADSEQTIAVEKQHRAKSMVLGPNGTLSVRRVSLALLRLLPRV